MNKQIKLKYKKKQFEQNALDRDWKRYTLYQTVDVPEI